jgi:glycosyltransferase involved in cell wall biosynthesis
VVIVAAHNEAQRIGDTLAALAAAFPRTPLWLADDASSDCTAAIARCCGAAVAGGGRRAGKGAAMTRAAEAALAAHAPVGPAPGVVAVPAPEPTFVLCDGDLGRSAGSLVALAEAVEHGWADLAIASFASPSGGGVGLLRAFARRAVRQRCGVQLSAPLSGQRALRAGSLRALLPFADGFGMELGMTLDAAAAGMRVAELELDLEHRARGRTPAGFAHRAQQLAHASRALHARASNLSGAAR